MPKEIQWVIEENPINGNETKLRNACDELGIPWMGIETIPFDYDFPLDMCLNEKYENIYYGSVRFIQRIREKYYPLGIFFNYETFTMRFLRENCDNAYVLNNMSSSTILPFWRFIQKSHEREDTEELFCRPNNDLKCFDGEVRTMKRLREWHAKLPETNFRDPFSVSRDTEILIGDVFHIEKEWRVLVVNGKVITGTQYRQKHMTYIANNVPDNLVFFVETICRHYTPYTVFVMDIALCADGLYYVLECGCANSAGLYNMNVKEYVKSLTEQVKFKQVLG